MIVITDSNQIISALMKPDGTIAKIFKDKGKIQFCAPDYIIVEIKNHFDKILKHRQGNKKQITDDFTFIINKIKVVKSADIPKKYIQEALEIVHDIDWDDFYFVALNRYKKYKIWTLDKKLIKGLEKKGYDICVTTSELRNYLYKK